MRRLGASDELCRLMLGLFASMAEQNDKLSWRLETALRQLWRRKSEKISPEQMLLFLAKLPATVAALAERPEGSELMTPGLRSFRSGELLRSAARAPARVFRSSRQEVQIPAGSGER